MSIKPLKLIISIFRSLDDDRYNEGIMEAKYKVKIIQQEEITSGVYYIKLNRLGDFIPGQLLAISDQPGGDVRYYSIASGLQENYWGILYNKVEDGWLTPWLSGLHRGDFLYSSRAFGKFLPVRTAMVWIATGTGIAPFYSMLKSGMGRDSILIHGARNKEGFYFYNTLKRELKNQYIACASQLKKDGLFSGRLSTYLQEDFSFPESTYYLCGSSTMVVNIRDLLLAKGVEFSKIISETYF